MNPLVGRRYWGTIQLQEEWWAGGFRDCNGESNGQDLPLETIQAEKICSGEVEEQAEALPVYEEPPPVYEEYEDPQPAYQEPQ